MLPTKFRVKWPFSSEEEAKNRLSRWPPWQPSWISHQNDFSYFWSTSHLPSFESIGPSVQDKKRKIKFQNGCHGGHLGFLIGVILAIFDLQVIPMLPTKFKVNKPFSSGEEAKNRFSRWPPWRPSRIFDPYLQIRHFCQLESTDIILFSSQKQMLWVIIRSASQVGAGLGGGGGGGLLMSNHN